MQEIEMHGRESKRKPSVEMNMHGGAKNRNWLFTRRVSELTCHQNALPMHGKCYFWNRQVTFGVPLNCGAADLRVGKKLKILQSVKTEILASGFCPLSFQSYVWIFALDFHYHFSDLCCLWKT